MHLENLLGKIKSNCRNLVHGAVPFDVCHNDHPGAQMPSGARSTPSNPSRPEALTHNPSQFSA